jgi:EpsI family protein
MLDSELPDSNLPDSNSEIHANPKPNVLRAALKVWLLPVVAILAAQGAAMHVLSIPEKNLVIPQLTNVPSQLGAWKTVSEQSLDPGVQEYLKPDSYILRDYANPETGSTVNVFVAYFKSLQSGYGPHSPAVCLPGNGWLEHERGVINLAVPGRAAGITVNKFVMEKADQHILVLYWYQNDRNVWAQEIQGKIRLIPDLIKYKRSDVSLVRLVQPMRSDDASVALPELKQFTNSLFPALAEDFRRAD